MSKILMLQGLPASGKSTYAKELVLEGWKRVNKDTLRAMIDDGKFSRNNENLIKYIETNIVKEYISGGYNIIIDDTNFNYQAYWEEIAKTHNAEFEVKKFDTPLHICIERDLKRGEKSVGKKVIMDMYNRYIAPTISPVAYDCSIPNAYIVDIDGTIAKMHNRGPYEWKKVKNDLPHNNIIDIVKNLAKDAIILFVSGRDEICRQDTGEWIYDNTDILPINLFMRHLGDTRFDHIIKKEIYDSVIKGNYNVLGVFDDRDQVVEMWRNEGLTCLQVNYGNF